MDYASLLFGAADSLPNHGAHISALLWPSTSIALLCRIPLLVPPCLLCRSFLIQNLIKLLQGSPIKKKEHICDNSFSINLLGFMDWDYQLEYVFLRKDGIPDHLKEPRPAPSCLENSPNVGLNPSPREVIKSRSPKPPQQATLKL